LEKNDTYKEADTFDSNAIFDIERAFKDMLLQRAEKNNAFI
jgi:hypothetical protein